MKIVVFLFGKYKYESYIYRVNKTDLKPTKMKTITITANLKQSVTKFGIIKHAIIRMFFNHKLCEVTITDNKDYWTYPNGDYKGTHTYKIWDTYAMLTSDRKGMDDCLRINADELIIISEVGNYRVREINTDDKKIYGVNNFKGLFLEPIE